MALDMLRARVAKDAFLQAADGKNISLVEEAKRGPVDLLASFSSYLGNENSVRQSHYAARF